MATISFVDVGQGDCSVAVNSFGEAIVIDCPRRRHEKALSELEARAYRQISVAIITHSDEDHAGGMLDLLEASREHFEGDLFFNCDSVLAIPVSGSEHKVAGMRRRALINRAREYGDRVKDARYGVGGSIGEISWKLMAPTVRELMDALADGDPNLASGVVLLSIDDFDTIIGGDAQLRTWERIKDELPKKATIRWPHHGGSISDRDHAEAQNRLFEILDPSRVIVSVGATNTHNHPFDAFFSARSAHGAHLICTEATAKCVTGGHGGQCAGTVWLEFLNGNFEVNVDAPNFETRIRSFGNAQCLRLSSEAER
jgi:competence protein ComEC